MLATETQLNKVCDYVGKIIIPSDDEPMAIDNDGPDDDDLNAEAGFDEEARLITEEGDIGTAGGAEPWLSMMMKKETTRKTKKKRSQSLSI